VYDDYETPLRRPASPPLPPPPPRPRERQSGRSKRRPRRWLRRLFWIGLFLLGVYLGLVMVVGLLLGTSDGVHDGSWVELRFTPEYPESRPDRTGLEGALSPTQLSAADVRATFDAIRRDPRVVGLLLRPDGFPGSWAQVEELRRELARLRLTGTRVVSYVEAPSSRAFALATAADELLMAPEGILLTVGLEARLSFLAGTLEKVGAQADFVAVGDYKSAPEQLQQQKPSEASREQSEVLLGDIYGWWLRTVGGVRGLSTAKLDSAVAASPLDAPSALERRMVDRVVDLGDWCDEEGLEAETDFFGPLEYLIDPPNDDRSGRVAVVYLDGSIASGSHGRDPVFGRVSGSDTVVERLRLARRDDSVDAVILRVDSPGGSAAASDAIYRELRRVRASKPIVVSMGGVAASGGYYVAMGADEVIADSLTVTGSIGVFSGKLVLAGLYEKIGMTHTTLRSGPNAGIFGDLEPFDDSQRSRLQTQLEAFYERFVAKVAADRELGIPAVRRAASGRVWSGQRALELGLVDGLGGFASAVASAESLAGLRSGAARVVDYQPSPGLYERVLQGFFRTQSGLRTGGDLGLVFDRLLPSSLASFDGSVQYRLPWQWEIR
jgi:protease IV